MELLKAAELQLSATKEENVNLREAIRGEREKNGVVSEWLVQEGEKVKGLEAQNQELRALLDKEGMTRAGSQGQLMGAERLISQYVDLLRETHAAICRDECTAIQFGRLHSTLCRKITDTMTSYVGEKPKEENKRD